MSSKLRLAILGCGAITRVRHLPAAAVEPRIELVALVDSNLDRAKALCQIHGIQCRVASDYRAVVGHVDAVINALPNHLHVPVNLECLGARMHVLCEKPLATTSEGALLCCEAAAQNGTVLAVGMPWRFQPGFRMLQSALDEGLFGRIEGYDWEHGMPYEWATASGFYFSLQQAGGGVLLDEGVHFLDCMLNCFGPVTSFKYEDDDWGSGVEANAVLLLQHDGPHGNVQGRIRLSRTYELKNRLSIRGERAHGAILRTDPGGLLVYLSLAGQEAAMTVRPREHGNADQRDAFGAMVQDFIDSVVENRPPLVDGWQALQVIELVQACYARRQRISEPWLDFAVKASEADR